MADVTRRPGAERQSFATSVLPRPAAWEVDAFTASYRTFRVVVRREGPAAALRDQRFRVNTLTMLCAQFAAHA